MKNGILNEFEDRENSSGHSGDSGRNSARDHKMATASSSSTKKRKALQKKVVSIPIKDLESSSRNKGEAAPPSDSWAWRKYGQKPIKGSPYPRGYYRCSSSKGCPARKQVERNRMDPTMLVVTYSSDHNHPWPLSSRNHNDHSPTHRHSPPLSSAVYDGIVDNVTPSKSESPDEVETKKNIADEKENDRFASLNVAAMDDIYGWFADMGCAGAMLESPMLAETNSNDTDISMLFPIMGEEDEYLFADLGELPECSTVFRQRDVAADVCGTQWCGATS